MLSDGDIKVWLMDGRVRIENFVEENLTPNGYDLTIAEIYIPKEERRIAEGFAEVPPTAWFAISTKESVELGDRIVAQLWIRTTWARKGVIASFGNVDAGFRGNLTLVGFNASHKSLKMSVGDTFAQMVFHELRTTAIKTYKDRSGKYQDQKGVTLDQP